MDGYRAVRILRELPEMSKVPIVACTAHDSESNRDEAMRAGFNEFLAKPIDFYQLDQTIKRFLKAA